MKRQSSKINKSLVDLARHNELPQFQYMDAETCQWISHNNPHHAAIPDISFYLPWLRKLPILQQWFLEPRIIDSLHGLRHLWRTAYFALYLACELGINPSEGKRAAIACLLHDIRRRNDRKDRGHASLSAAWFEAHTDEIARHWGITLSHEDIASIKAAIALHETPYETFSSAQRSLYEKEMTLIDIVKSADALDRYRLPKLTWWINDNHLALAPPPHLKQLAFEIVVASEKNFLGKDDNYESVRKAVESVESERIHLSPAWIDAHLSFSSLKIGEEPA